MKKIICAIAISLIASVSYAANVTTDNTLVNTISVWTKDGVLLLQTNPRHQLPPGCTNDYWLVMDKNDLGYQATLAMLLSAQAQKKAISVTADDRFTTSKGFCGLTRVVIRDN